MNHPQRHQQNQPQQPAKPPEPPKFEPNRRTIFLVQTDAKFEPRAREHIMDTWGDGKRDPDTDQLIHSWRVQTEIDAGALTADSVLVILHIGDRIKDQTTGKWRARKKVGTRHPDYEPPPVLQSRPIACRECWVQPQAGDDYLDRAKLLRLINDEIKPNRAQLDIRKPQEKSRDAMYTLSVRAT